MGSERRFQDISWAQHPFNPIQKRKEIGKAETAHALLPVCVLVTKVTKLSTYFFTYIFFVASFMKSFVTFITTQES